MKEKKTYIYGRHALVEALSCSPKTIKKIFLAPSMDDEKLLSLIKETQISVSELSENTSGKEERNVSHQGVIALVDNSKLMIPYKEFIESLEITKDTSLVLMGELQDPQNIGAVIRSSAAFGASGVFMPTHNQGQITGAVVKVSVGMVFKVPLVSVENLDEVIIDLKERGFRIYGLAGDGDIDITCEQFDAPSVFIVGNESKGLSDSTHDLCDSILSIPIDKKCESLNAAVSSSVVLYAWSIKHKDVIDVLPTNNNKE